MTGRTERMRLVGLLALVAIGLIACGGEDTPEFPIGISADRIERGAEVYAAQCATCHGAVNGVPALPTAPPHGPEGHTWHHPDRLLFEWVSDGPPAGTIMSGFGGVLTEEEIVSVLAYIKAQWPDAIRERQRQGSAAYEAQLRE